MVSTMPSPNTILENLIDITAIYTYTHVVITSTCTVGGPVKVKVKSEVKSRRQNAQVTY